MEEQLLFEKGRFCFATPHSNSLKIFTSREGEGFEFHLCVRYLKFNSLTGDYFPLHFTWVLEQKIFLEIQKLNLEQQEVLLDNHQHINFKPIFGGELFYKIQKKYL